MTEPTAFRYRAFISYSHADTAWAKWLHRGLESFRIDKDLAGRETATGTVPKSLRPVFRDRDDFTAGHSLSDQTLAALDASAALIVLCSPTAAKSEYVTEEIRLFKSRHPERPVIPLIVDGTPGDPELECFPPSLTFKLDADGKITEQPVELLAADAREEGDGKTLALAKVVAGLLGVSSDNIFRRAERERRKRQRNWIAGLSCVAIMLAGLAVWAEINRREAVAQREEAERNFTIAKQGADSLIFDIAYALRDQEGMRTETVRKILDTAEQVIDKLVAKSPHNVELLHVRLAMLNQFANTYAAQGDTPKQEEAARKALAAADRLAKADPDNDTWQFDLSVSHTAVGEALYARGDYAEALKAYQDGLAIAQRLAKAHPDNQAIQLNLSVSQDKVGVVLFGRADLAEALKIFEARLAIIDRQVRANPNDAALQRELSVANERIGHVLQKQKRYSRALKFYEAKLAIIARLAESDPSNADWQRDLSVAHSKIGDLFLLQSKWEQALKSYRASLAINARLTKLDPDNANWQRDLSFGHYKIGEVLAIQGKISEALPIYRRGLGIAERLSELHPSNAGWDTDVFITKLIVGNMAVAVGNVDEALDAFQGAQTIAERWAKSDPTSVRVQRSLAQSGEGLGDVFKLQGSFREAIKWYQDSLSIRSKYTETETGISRYQYELAENHRRLAEVLAQQGERARALIEYRKARDITARLNKQSPSNITHQNDLTRYDGEIARLEQAGAAAPEAADAEHAAP